MSDRRFQAVAVAGVVPGMAVQIVRSYDGRIFAMSADEARILAAQIDKAADQAEARRAKANPNVEVTDG